MYKTQDVVSEAQEPQLGGSDNAPSNERFERRKPYAAPQLLGERRNNTQWHGSDKGGREKRFRHDQLRSRHPRRPYQKAAAELFKSRVVNLFVAGRNTVEIAAEVNATEAKVYNTLARLAE